MAARRANLFRGSVELGFIFAAFLCGLLDAPIWVTGAAGIALIAFWGWSRRASLARMRGANLLTQSAIAVALMVAVFAGAFWLGRVLGGS